MNRKSRSRSRSGVLQKRNEMQSAIAASIAELTSKIEGNSSRPGNTREEMRKVQSMTESLVDYMKGRPKSEADNTGPFTPFNRQPQTIQTNASKIPLLSVFGEVKQEVPTTMASETMLALLGEGAMQVWPEVDTQVASSQVWPEVALPSTSPAQEKAFAKSTSPAQSSAFAKAKARLSRVPATGTTAAPGTPPETPEEKKKRKETAAKKAQALATLICYGLVDPSDEMDLTKAVHAMATATGDQATALLMGQQAAGARPSQALAMLPGGNAGQEQQNQMQQMIDPDEYAQFWVQQQFVSQMALYENEQQAQAEVEVPLAKEENMKEYQKEYGRDRRFPMPRTVIAGDWICPKCGGHQFARNRVCRHCRTSKPLYCDTKRADAQI